MLYDMEYPFSQFGTVVRIVSPLNLYILNILTSRTVGKRENLDTV